MDTLIIRKKESNLNPSPSPCSGKTLNLSSNLNRDVLVFSEFLQNFSEGQILWSLSFSCFYIEIACSREKCEKFGKTSTQAVEIGHQAYRFPTLLNNSAECDIATPFWSDTIVYSDWSITNIITALSQHRR